MIQKASLLFLLSVCTSCTSSRPITASLDRSAWFGSLSNGTPKIYFGNKLGLIFNTDLPHPELKQKPVNKPTGCKEPCVSTQTLLIGNIPLQVGRYVVSSASSADSLGPTGVVSSYLAKGIDRINTRVYSQASGWLLLTHYDSATGLVKGKFDIRFQENQGGLRSVHFRRGKLNFLLGKKRTT